MAKTLIGNIKGKNGRGITSIKKTGTTGPVDTYTITYTDSTTSTFTVNNSDNIALQRQIVPSAAVESSATASQAYAAGDYVVVGGVLRKVTSSITKGSTIGDSNSTATTVAGEIAAARDSASKIGKRVLLWSGTAGKAAKLTINSGYTFGEFKSFYCLTSADSLIGLPLVSNASIAGKSYLYGITGWDDGINTFTLAGLVELNSDTTATIGSISKHTVDGANGTSGKLLKLWGCY
nr:MAG TPA: hypothetical protein [Herelleviridae sp.]